MANSKWRKTVCICAASSAMLATLSAQTYTELVSFNNYNGAKPSGMRLAQGLDGNYYGTTAGGFGYTGGSGYGTIFRMTPDGAVTTLYRFGQNDPSGSAPFAGLVQVLNGDFWGTTCAGGDLSAGSSCGLEGGYGTIFKITPNGDLATIHIFENTDGAAPFAVLTRGADGSFYGTTSEGGAANFGTIFRITPNGAFTTLHDFSGPDGCNPQDLVLGTEGDVYGTTNGGGATYQGPQSVGFGTVYKITPSGNLTTLHSFDNNSGESPYSGLTLGADGNFYGTTYSAGPKGYGTVYKVTPGGKLTVLHAFAGADGAFTRGGLVSANDGNLYGTTLEGGAYSWGNIFRVTPEGRFASLFSFSGPTREGYQPSAAMLQGTDGNFYGTTSAGGVDNMGVVFRFSFGLPPFVKALPHLAKVGDRVDILGTDLKDATSVSFNGTVAAFEVVSPSEIATTVPAGATNGYIHVTTPSGTLASGGPFLVQ